MPTDNSNEPPCSSWTCSPASSTVSPTRTPISRARSRRSIMRTRSGMRVIYVVVAFRPGAPEASEFFRAYAAALVDAQPVMTPADGDVVVAKKRVSAFAGSDLEVLLRTNDIRHLVLCGIATSGVVLSTLREAARQGLRADGPVGSLRGHGRRGASRAAREGLPEQATVITARSGSRRPERQQLSPQRSQRIKKGRKGAPMSFGNSYSDLRNGRDAMRSRKRNSE